MTPAEALRLLAAANPVPLGSLELVAAERTNQLLERLRGEQIDPTAIPNKSGASRRGSRLLAVTVAGAVTVVAAAAIALAGNGRPFTDIAAFVGIGSADHARTGQDVLDPQASEAVERMNTMLAQVPGGLERRLLPENARLVGQLPVGRNVYVLETSGGDLCVLTTTSSFCGHPLRKNEPVSVGQERRGPKTAPIAWGLARDGVISVSFRASGREVTVPIKNNVWFYVGENNALGVLTIHFADGTSKTIDYKHRHRR